MPMKYLLALLATVSLLEAHAHTALTASVPADGTSVTLPVREIVLEFGGEVRLTSVALADAAGAHKEIAAAPTATAERFSLAVSGDLAPGEYTVTWRAVGGDTHIVSGEFRFTVAAAHAH
jgi:hypothetical protein